MADIKERFIMVGIYRKMMDDILGNLKNEIEQLTSKVQKAREDENWGTYRNLIISYKEVIKLYKEIVDEFASVNVDKTQYINSHLTIKCDDDVTKFINEMIKSLYTKPNKLC
jgi:hypothetical protein